MQSSTAASWLPISRCAMALFLYRCGFEGLSSIADEYFRIAAAYSPISRSFHASSLKDCSSASGSVADGRSSAPNRCAHTFKERCRRTSAGGFGRNFGNNKKSRSGSKASGRNASSLSLRGGRLESLTARPYGVVGRVRGDGRPEDDGRPETGLPGGRAENLLEGGRCGDGVEGG